MRSQLVKWQGGEHEFALSVDDLIALQDRCGGDGVGLILQRLSTGQFAVNDVISTVSLGLEPNLPKIEANRKVRTIAEDQGLQSLALTAQAILAAALLGWPEDEDQGEDQGEAPENP